jgi:integrase
MVTCAPPFGRAASSKGNHNVGWVFPPSTKSGHIEQGSAKNQHSRAIRALTSARTVFEQWKKDGRTGDWTRRAAKVSGTKPSFLDRHSEAVKVFEKFEPYCLRHTALTRLAEAGCDAFTLAKIAGHSSITITQRYCHPQTEAIQRAFAKLPSHSIAAHGTRRGSLAGAWEKGACRGPV